MRQFIRSLALRLALAAAFLVFVPALAGGAFAQSGVRVTEVKFKGNRSLDPEVLRQMIRTKKGQILDESLLNEDIKSLYDVFSTVEVRRETQGDSVVLTFVVSENVLATSVGFRGASEVSENDLRAVIDTAKGKPVAEFRLENDARKIERLYRLRGHHFVEVKTETEDTEGGGRAVVFQVLEGPKVSVDTITFKGNDHIARSKLLDFSATQESGFLGLSGGDFVQENLVKDRNAWVSMFRREGFLNATVTVEDVTFSDDRRDAYVTVVVNEGPEFTVGSVKIVGAEGFPGGSAALTELLALQTGKRFRSEDLLASRNSLQSAYHEEGFYSAVVDYEDRPQGTSVDVTFKIDEQSKVRLRNLTILGNEITQDKVIRREISVYPGEVINQNEIDKSVDRLRRLGYFTNVAADVQKLGEGDDPNLRDVSFTVDDTAKTGQVRFAVGASSDLGLLGSFTVTKRNFDWRDWPERFGDIFNGRAFTGAGQTFQLEISPGTSYSNYRLAFTEPWLFDKPISFGWDLFFSKFTRFDYDVDRSGIDFTLGRRFTFEGRKVDTVLGVSGTTRIESVDLSNVRDDTAPTAFLAEGRNSLIAERFTFRVDRLKQGFDPTDGWYAQWTPEIGFAGDVRLFKHDLEAKRYFTVAKTDDERLHTITLGTHAGFASALSSSVEADDNLFDNRFVPTYERYFAGGSSSVRGFEYGGAGPHGQGNPFLGRLPGESQAERNLRVGNTAKSVLENDGDPLGGDVMFLANVEYGFPLYEDILRGVFFLDGGMVRDSVGNAHGLDRGEVDRLRAQLSQGGKRQKQLAAQLDYDDGGGFFQDIRASIGVGVRIKLPMFGQTPIALDFGFPIRKRDGDDTQVLSFSIARDF